MALRAGHKVVLSDFDILASVATKTALETVTSSTTLQNDDQLFVPHGINARYDVDGYLIYDGAGDTGVYGAAGGLKLFFTAGAGSVMNWTNFGANQGALTSCNVVMETLVSTPRFLATNTAGAWMTCHLKGTLITAGTAGNLQLQWAQAGSSATSTRVAANSTLAVRRTG